jgi:hypothetical protein
VGVRGDDRRPEKEATEKENNNNVIKNLSLLRQVTSSMAEKREPSLPASVSVAATRSLECDEEGKLCYNCGRKGHSFMDCVARCGRCEGDGHKTMDCSIFNAKYGLQQRLEESKRGMEKYPD